MLLENINKILVVNLGGIGDLLLATPALRALRDIYPKAFISVLVTPKAYAAIKDLTYLDGIFIFYLDPCGKIPFSRLFCNLKTLLTLREKRFDMAINMRSIVSKASAFKMKMLFDIIRPRVRVGRDTEQRGYFFDIKISEEDIGKKYEMDYDIETIKALGGYAKNRHIDFEIKEEDFRKTEQILEKESVSTAEIIIGLHLGGKPSHRWPIENLSEVISVVNRKIKCRFVATGEKSDSHLADNLQENAGVPIINTCGKLSLKELGALIKRCNVYISNDTAPMHIAATLNVPLIAIFGPGYFDRFDPKNTSSNAVTFYKAVGCAPCNQIDCKSKECFQGILPQEIINALFGLLEKNKK
jgi:heptosyltransferase-2